MRIRSLSSARLVLVVAFGAAAWTGREAYPGEPPVREPEPRADAELMAAARTGDLDLVVARLHAGADVNAPAASGETPLLQAAVKGHVDVVRALVDAGADVNANRRGWGSPLDAAERAGQDEVAALLRAAGARSASGRAVGDTVCVRPWKGDGYCGTVEAARHASYRIRITAIVGCAGGCAPRAECSAGRTIGGRTGLGVGDEVATVSWCLTHTGVVP